MNMLYYNEKKRLKRNIAIYFILIIGKVILRKTEKKMLNPLGK